MKFRKLIHHILITIGLALGVIATGTTVNAKAQQLNSNNTNNNNPSSDQNINSNQFQNPTNVLINIPRQNQNFYNDNTYNQNNFNNDHYNNEYVQDDSDMRYQRSNLSSQNYNDQSNYQNSPASPKFNPANLSNYNPSQEQVNFNKTNNSNSAKDLYKDILLNTARHFNNKNNNRNTPSKSKNSTIANKTNHIKTHTMKLSAATGKSTQHRLRPVHKNYRKSRHWFRDGLSRQNLKARSWVSWHESNHRWRVLSYGGVCVGYFQLSPSYLGYKHGHVNLNKRHQVKVADAYVRGRYGNWINAKRFWETHHWY